MTSIRNTVLFALALFLSVGQANAQQQFEKQSGDYTVYYSLFPSSFLQADIAANYGITRAKDRAILNVSVRRTADGGSQPQSALISGTYSDLVHSQDLAFEEIREKDAVYYLSEIRVSSRTTLYFDLQLTPDPNAPAIVVRFNKEVFPE